MVPPVEQFPKVQKKKRKKERCQMLLEPIIMAIINLLNLQVVPDKNFLKLCLQVFMLLHFFVDSGNLFHFEGLIKKVSFEEQLFCEKGALR